MWVTGAGRAVRFCAGNAAVPSASSCAVRKRQCIGAPAAERFQAWSARGLDACVASGAAAHRRATRKHPGGAPLLR